MTTNRTPPADVMLDIETMGTRAGSMIAAIGARTFGPHTDLRSFRVAVQLRGQHAYGLTIDADTVLWWLRQDDAARAGLAPDQAIALPLALEAFADWLGRVRGAADRTLRLWCNGPAFDAALLDHAYHAAGQRTPWHHWEPRDLRTLLDLARIDRKQFPPRVAHDALEDARAQAEAAEVALRKLSVALDVEA